MYHFFSSWLFTNFWFYSVFSQSASDFDFCVVVEQLYVDCSCSITLAIDTQILRDGDDDDSEQKINIGRKFQVALPN